MKKLNLLLISILAISLLSLIVYAGFTFPGPDGTISLPTQGTVLTSTSVNFSIMVNNTNDHSTRFNWTVYNSSVSGRNYSVLFSVMVFNATQNSTLITMKDGQRHYWYSNITNATTNASTNNGVNHTKSPQKIFNVNLDYYRLIFGSQGNINFTLDTGNINSSGIIKARYFRSENITDTINFACDGSTVGVIAFNRTQGFIGCTPEGWKRMNGSTP